VRIPAYRRFLLQALLRSIRGGGNAEGDLLWLLRGARAAKRGELVLWIAPTGFAAKTLERTTTADLVGRNNYRTRVQRTGTLFLMGVQIN